MLYITTPCFFHNRAKSIAYQVVYTQKVLCLLTAKACHRRTHRHTDRQTDRQKSDFNSGTLSTNCIHTENNLIKRFLNLITYSYEWSRRQTFLRVLFTISSSRGTINSFIHSFNSFIQVCRHIIVYRIAPLETAFGRSYTPKPWTLLQGTSHSTAGLISR